MCMHLLLHICTDNAPSHLLFGTLKHSKVRHSASVNNNRDEDIQFDSFNDYGSGFMEPRTCLRCETFVVYGTKGGNGN